MRPTSSGSGARPDPVRYPTRQGRRASAEPAGRCRQRTAVQARAQHGCHRPTSNRGFRSNVTTEGADRSQRTQGASATPTAHGEQGGRTLRHPPAKASRWRKSQEPTTTIAPTTGGEASESLNRNPEPGPHNGLEPMPPGQGDRRARPRAPRDPVQGRRRWSTHLAPEARLQKGATAKPLRAVGNRRRPTCWSARRQVAQRGYDRGRHNRAVSCATVPHPAHFAGDAGHPATLQREHPAVAGPCQCPPSHQCNHAGSPGSRTPTHRHQRQPVPGNRAAGRQPTRALAAPPIRRAVRAQPAPTAVACQHRLRQCRLHSGVGRDLPDDPRRSTWTKPAMPTTGSLR